MVLYDSTISTCFPLHSYCIYVVASFHLILLYIFYFDDVHMLDSSEIEVAFLYVSLLYFIIVTTAV